MLKIINVKDDSPLNGKIVEGDYLLSICGEEVSNNQNLSRILTMLSQRGDVPDYSILFLHHDEVTKIVVPKGKLGISATDEVKLLTELQKENHSQLLKEADQGLFDPDSVKVFTVENLPAGYDYKLIGLARGGTARAKNAISDIGAGLKNIVGGEVGTYTKLMADGRELALERLQKDALRMGANGVIAVRFTSSTVDVGIAEVTAYGTAIFCEKFNEL